MSPDEEAKYLARQISLEGERRALADDMKELAAQMKNDGATPLEIKATKAAAKRHFEDGNQAEKRETA